MRFLAKLRRYMNPVDYEQTKRLIAAEAERDRVHDLARELYEALKALNPEPIADGFTDNVPLFRIQSALGRYEREVERG